MKKKRLLAIPLLLAGFVLPDEKCGNADDSPPVMAALPDGPYVLYKNNSIVAKYIADENGTMMARIDSIPVSDRDKLQLTVATDEAGKRFTVALKDQLVTEKTEYPHVNRQFVISDIEGNFRAFRKMLQVNGIIDTALNWTFGEGHLVLTGDYFDRGNQVTEVLWLIYTLEEKAKAAGGYVHFILGNHEIMNMSGDLRYVHKKYIDNSLLLKEKYETLFSEQSELGRWLRTKNVMEKIGDVLYAHGGISSAVNRMALSAEQTNQLIRPWYADSTYQYNDPRVDTLYSDWGPFWYRGYYAGVRASHGQLDSTLSKYAVKHVATGHTVIADTVSMLYGGKLFNTDVHHARGISEALYIENSAYYRVTLSGEKFLLWKD
jgi:hypothetical protein